MIFRRQRFVVPYHPSSLGHCTCVGCLPRTVCALLEKLGREKIDDESFRSFFSAESSFYINWHAIRCFLKLPNLQRIRRNNQMHLCGIQKMKFIQVHRLSCSRVCAVPLRFCRDQRLNDVLVLSHNSMTNASRKGTTGAKS